VVPRVQVRRHRATIYTRRGGGVPAGRDDSREDRSARDDDGRDPLPGTCPASCAAGQRVCPAHVLEYEDVVEVYAQPCQNRAVGRASRQPTTHVTLADATDPALGAD
jgi:hypothetical protein